MRQQFVIDGRLDGLNEYTRACRSNPLAGARMKRGNQDIVCRFIKAAKLKPCKTPVYIHYAYYEAPKRKGARLRDRRNISSFASKVIEDALQEMGIIDDDGWDEVLGGEELFFRATGSPRIVVTIEEAV
jgi:hypothetical protein